MDTRKIAPWLRWSAQGVGMLLVLLIAFMVVGEALASKGPVALPQLTPFETWGVVAVFISMAGILLAWWRPRPGGGLTLAGGTLFNLIQSLESKQLDLFWFAVVFMVVGALLLASGWLSKAPRST
jgi:hypothetical protein